MSISHEHKDNDLSSGWETWHYNDFGEVRRCSPCLRRPKQNNKICDVGGVSVDQGRVRKEGSNMCREVWWVRSELHWLSREWERGTDNRDQAAEAHTAAATKNGSVIISLGNDCVNYLLLFRSQAGVLSSRNERWWQQTALCVNLQDAHQATPCIICTREQARNYRDQDFRQMYWHR